VSRHDIPHVRITREVSCGHRLSPCHFHVGESHSLAAIEEDGDGEGMRRDTLELLLEVA
jgi:hypothetical protein